MKKQEQREETEDDYKPERKSRNFEFTDNLCVMRIVRTILYIQVLEFILDNPSIKIPVVFQIFCRTICYYSVRFYSRPFLDILYILQHYGSAVINYITLLNSNQGQKAEFHISDRRELSSSTTSAIDFEDLRTFHVLKYIGHYFMSALFAVIAVLFTFYFWEIQDFTDRNILRTWIKKYVADGWWKRGGLHITIIMIKACFVVNIGLCILYVVSRQFNQTSFPTATMIAGACTLSACIIIVVTLLAVALIRSAESAFVRYVSQNVGYTSTMILKRVVKAKVEIGLALMLLIYTPALYTFLQSLIFVTDWNDSHAQYFKLKVNYNVPCFIQAFPPFVEYKDRTESMFTCPIQSAISDQETVRPKAYYETSNIVQCDTYLGILFFIIGALFTSFLCISYGYILWRLISLVTKAFKESRWVKPLYAVQDIYRAECIEYKKNFPFVQRFILLVRAESIKQLGYIQNGFYFIGSSMYSTIKCFINISLFPISCTCAPVVFFGKRIFILTCNQYTKEGRQRKILEELRKKQHDIVHDHIQLEGAIDIEIDDDESHQDEALEEQEKLSSVRSNKEIFTSLFLRAKFIICGTNNVALSLKNSFHRMYQTINHLEILAILRVQWMYFKRFIFCVKDKSINFSSLPGAKLAKWRSEFLITTKEKRLRELRKDIVQEVTISKYEFVTDHDLAIGVFDRVFDTGGIFMLISPYDMQRLEWTMVIWLELTLYAVFAAFSTQIVDWKYRGALISLTTLFFGILTYIFSPYTEEADKWFDFLGRVMIVGTFFGIYISESLVPLGYKPFHVNKFSPWMSIDDFLSLPFGSLALYLLIDCVMVAFFYIYIVNVLSNIGAFQFIERKIESMKFSMHDNILNFLVHKADEITFGAENIYTGLQFIQQWDDVIKQQRRYALLLWPEVRPSWLISAKAKLIEMKWASLFNLTIKNIRSSVGLTFLHTTMCTADAEVSRWIMHQYPELLNVEDSQRDTPLTIALKECSYFLVVYSNLNGGNLDDGTSYSDNAFYDYYPEALDIRSDIIDHGEHFPELTTVYVLQANEMNFLKLHGHFTERPPEEKKVVPQKPKKSLKKVLNKPLPSRRKKGGKAAASSNLEADLFVNRFPEDEVYDNYESGEMSCWNILGLHVPLTTIQINEIDENAELAEEDNDLKGVIKTLQVIDTLKNGDPIPKTHPFIEELDNFDDGFLRGLQRKKTILQSMTDAKAMSTKESGGNGLFSFLFGINSKLSHREVRWKMCKFADILLSREISDCIKTYNWNTDAYLDFNRLSSKIQGEVAQQLAFACNFGPPEGFSRISNWTKVILPPEYEEFEGIHGDEYLKPLVDTFNYAKKVGNTFGQPLANITKHFQFAKKENRSNENEFNDRIVSFLADCVVSSRERLDLCDCELSGPARIGFRAICRALRRKHSSFIIPSIFVAPRRIIIKYMELRQNELDCGDAVILADAIICQQSLKLLDLSMNRIGARGMIKLCKVLKAHESITTFRISHNRIGPAAGREIGLLLKQSKTLKVLSIAHNRMGDLVRYPYPQKREKMSSAARDILWGLKENKNLEVLDLSYNHLGPKLAEVLPLSIKFHPTLMSIDISGNDLGRQGSIMIWAISGDKTDMKSIFLTAADKALQEAADPNSVVAADDDEDNIFLLSGKRNAIKYINLCSIGLADNQLGISAGKALSLLLKNNKKLTSLDLSGNSLGFEGGLEVAEALEKIYGVEARERKKQIFDELTQQVTKRKRTKKVVYTSLVYLNLRRNGLGPAVVSSLMQCCEKPNCTITNLDVSDNPLSYTANNTGSALVAGLDIRSGIGKNFSLLRLNIANTGFSSTQVIPILGGLGKNNFIRRINLNGIQLDEPSCLQLSNALYTSNFIEAIELADAKMGPKGGGLILGTIEQIRSRIKKVDISGNNIGSYAIIPLAKAISQSDCAIVTLDVSRNLLEADGGCFIAKALIKNNKITDIDMSSNSLNFSVAEFISDALRGLYINGRKVADTVLRRIVISDNPSIGPVGSKVLMLAAANDVTEHVEFSNIGGGPGMAKVVAQFMRKVTVPWTYLDISNNDFLRGGMNPIFWSLRHNNRIRIFKIANNKAGSVFGTDSDAVSIHGISICRAIYENMLLTHLDVSYNNLSSDAGNNIFEALKSNLTIRKLNVAGNLFDDSCAVAIGELIRENDILIDIDMSHNKLGFAVGVNMAEAMIQNHAIKTLNIGYNRIGGAGTATVDIIYQFICMNYTLRTLILDGNRLGNEWGVRLAEAFARNSTLTQISMNSTRVSAEAGKALVDMYENNSYLMELGLGLDEIGIANYTRLRTIFNNRKAFLTVDSFLLQTEITVTHHHHSKFKSYDHHSR